MTTLGMDSPGLAAFGARPNMSKSPPKRLNSLMVGSNNFRAFKRKSTVHMDRELGSSKNVNRRQSFMRSMAANMGAGNAYLNTSGEKPGSISEKDAVKEVDNEESVSSQSEKIQLGAFEHKKSNDSLVESNLEEDHAE